MDDERDVLERLVQAAKDEADAAERELSRALRQFQYVCVFGLLLATLILTTAPMLWWLAAIIGAVVAVCGVWVLVMVLWYQSRRREIEGDGS